MRPVLLSAVLAALVLASDAVGAATQTVTIGSSGFSPKTIQITADDTIVWRNADSKNHQVVSVRGTFASPVLAPGRSYSFTFTEAGTYDYRDALFPNRTGTVKVAGLPPALTLGVSQPQVAWGLAVTISGVVNNRKAGEQVTLTAQPHGQPSPIVLATVVTGDGGGFSLITRPQLLTVYQATWKSAKSLPAATTVAPVVTFGRANGWVVRVWAGRSMAGKSVQVQRLSEFGQWVTVKKVQLGESSRARFTLSLPEGQNRLRIAMSVNQAGAGYLAGFSKEVRYTQT